MLETITNLLNFKELEVKENKERNGIEVYFTSYPGKDVINTLKENCFRWSNFKKCWYIKQDQLGNKKETAPDVKESYSVKDSPLYELYKNEMMETWHGDQKMVDFELKNCNYIVQLNNGDYYIIEKPRIEKDFCFGYSDCGQGQSFDEAQETAQAAHNEKYFMDQNLKDINETIQEFETRRTPGADYRGELKFYKTYKYTNGQERHQKAIRSFYTYETYNEDGELAKEERRYNYKFTELTDQEIDAIITGYKEVKRQFVKRLNAYLKKYGVSKLHIWTYWLDE